MCSRTPSPIFTITSHTVYKTLKFGMAIPSISVTGNDGDTHRFSNTGGKLNSFRHGDTGQLGLKASRHRYNVVERTIENTRTRKKPGLSAGLFRSGGMPRGIGRLEITAWRWAPHR